MMKKYIYIILFTFFLVNCKTIDLSNVHVVNPMIGTGKDGRISPVAVVPFGMVQLGPDTRQSLNGYH